MDERDRAFDPPPTDSIEGGMTGATGSLTPDDPDEAFVPAETREISDPSAARDERTAPNDRDGGYGTEHGLASDDPAYAQEEHLGSTSSTSAGPVPRDTQLGGDEARAPEDEHF